MDALEDRTLRAERAGTWSRRYLSRPTIVAAPSSWPTGTIVKVLTLALGLGGSILLGWVAGGILLAVP